jgi:predicted acylesterase/phospholipase RssA/CRP-like cAMP-binding protein
MHDGDVPQRHPTTDPATTLDDALRRLFDGVGPDVLAAIRDAAVVSGLRGGEVLFREGDPGDAAFVVLTGRLRAVAGPVDDERVLSDAVHGETMGELALLTGSPRSATAYAVRDSTVARLETAAFDGLLAAHPEAALPIMRLLAERLRRATSAPQVRPPDEVTVAVLPLGGVDAAAFAVELAAAVGSMLPAVTVAPPADDPPAADDGSPAADLAARLEGLEATTAVVVYVGEPGPGTWNDTILRRADEVVLLADADADPAMGPAEPAVFAPRERGGPRVTLVLTHPPGRDPEGTVRWLDARPPVSHLHVRAGDGTDVARVARWVTGRSVGLVLGGGGARGWAHIGAMKALLEAGIPVDRIGGTSQGALVGAALADRHTPDEILRVGADYVRKTKDYTAPVVSVLRGRHILRGIRRVVRPGTRVEDLWLPFFAVATNLTRAELLVIDRGPLVDAIRSSVSLPVVLPPVVRDGDLIVDGGLLDNLPIGQMRRRMPTGPIIAVDPSPRRSHEPYDALEPDASGWALLRDRLLRRGRSGRVPSLGDIVQRTVVVGSIHLRHHRDPDPDVLVLAPDLGDWALLDFGALDVIAEAGYREMREPARAWWAARADTGGGPGA